MNRVQLSSQIYPPPLLPHPHVETLPPHSRPSSPSLLKSLSLCPFPPSDPSSSAFGPLLGAECSGTSGPVRESCPCAATAVPPQVDPASFGAPSLPSASRSFLNLPTADVPSETDVLPSPSWADVVNKENKSSGCRCGGGVPWKPGQGESIPAPQHPKTLRKSPSKPKPSVHPPSAPAGRAQEVLSPKRVANSAEAGVKIASAVQTSNAFAALQNLVDSIPPEEPQGIPPPDSHSSSRDQSFPVCDPPIPEVVKLVEIPLVPPPPSSLQPLEVPVWWLRGCPLRSLTIQ
ncbi:hypothetical protein Nepgr_020453 [Nepenthes gracilis]|uniref:Uncharacterized protein n=1 Tax=Nepenthes gracilis TaxID=150966 RepID=A0AAD3XV31_NEPGR|nr:hypothetical protein Nepgr_020453 [Nepenthes gracilis]